MKRQTKRLLDLDQEILLRALFSERIRMVADIKDRLTESVRNLNTENAVSALGQIMDRAINDQADVAHLRDAIEELEKNMGMVFDDQVEKDIVKLKSLSSVFSADDIPF